MKKLLLLAYTGFIILLAAYGPALAQDCSITGTITADRNPDPNGNAWLYTLVVDWSTLKGLSHISLIMDGPDGTCTCDEFAYSLDWEGIIGSSTDGSCAVDYAGFLECDGDPSIPGVEGIILKFEPVYDEDCEPGRTGRATFVFSSNLPPVPVDEDLLSIVEKDGLNACFGTLSGFFPALACDPLGADAASLGTVKSMYR